NTSVEPSTTPRSLGLLSVVVSNMCSNILLPVTASKQRRQHCSPAQSCALRISASAAPASVPRLDELLDHVRRQEQPWARRVRGALLGALLGAALGIPAAGSRTRSARTSIPPRRPPRDRTPRRHRDG